MKTDWIHPALGALALAGVAGGAHAAWGHSVYTHLEAYRHLEACAGTRTGSAAEPNGCLHEAVTIRAFDTEAAAEPQARKARRSLNPTDPARS